MKTAEGGYPFCLENRNGGWWAEGTAYTALMYKLRGDDTKYEEAMNALEGTQLESGLFPAATVDDLSTVWNSSMVRRGSIQRILISLRQHGL